jgi:hypothetical protein
VTLFVFLGRAGEYSSHFFKFRALETPWTFLQLLKYTSLIRALGINFAKLICNVFTASERKKLELLQKEALEPIYS